MAASARAAMSSEDSSSAAVSSPAASSSAAVSSLPAEAMSESEASAVESDCEATAEESEPDVSAAESPPFEPQGSSGADSASEEEAASEKSESEAAAASVSSGADDELETYIASEEAASEKSESEAAAASASSGTVEQFRAGEAATLAEHITNHEYPANVATCGPCTFWKNRWKWSAEFTCLNPVTQKKVTWLGYRNGFAVCLICVADKSAATRTMFGKGLGSLLRKQYIKGHENCGPHAAAVLAWQQRLRAEAELGEEVSIFNDASGRASASTVASAVAVPTRGDIVAIRTREQTAGSRAVVAVRALLETSGSFRSLNVWFAALAGEGRQALESEWHCKRLVRTMAEYERALTHRILKEGAVFRLQADGLERTYQVEIGTLLWSLPAALQHLPSHGEQAGWLHVLGPRGPWIVERIIGMQEFPQDMGCDGKASMLEACVRRACLSHSGEVDPELHQHVRKEMRAWCSDGADLQVPLAASGCFPGLVFLAWDESHSGQRLLANALNAVEGDEEIKITDKLLVTGKKPYSLAKFLSTSMVFRKTVGDAQFADEIAFVKNFGWAPQRFTSRARPYARESRRWKVLFEAVAMEGAGADPTRRALARMFLAELGGQNSSRLVLGGLLADLSAEHYTWVASGDKGHPDATTVYSRADAFVERLDTLFTKGLILSLPDTYTGATLKFLQNTSYYKLGASVQTIGIGDWETDESARWIIKNALGRVQVVVANMKEYMTLYRAEHSWLYAFTAFRLPSPLSGSDQMGRPARTEVEGSLRRICREAKLPEEQTLREFKQLLPRAEKLSSNGVDPRAAWGRASAEWPELSSGRRLAELFLIWKTASGNLERRFRRFRETRCPQRAKMLDISVENILLVEQAPPSKMLRASCSSFAGARGSLDQAGRNPYIEHIAKLHLKIHGKAKQRIRHQERRDAGISRGPASGNLGPETEAAFGRKRAAAITDAVEASPSKRARMIRNAHIGLSQVAQEAAEESLQNPVAASAAAVSRVAKRAVSAKDCNLRGAQAAADARAKREQKVVQSSTRPRQGLDAHLAPTRRAGIMLVCLNDVKARNRGRKLHFQLVSDPLVFVAKVAQAPASAMIGHVVIAPPADTDYAISATIAAALMGCFVATPPDFLKSGVSPPGIMYKEKYKTSAQSYHVAVSAALAEEMPTLAHLLRAIAQAPGSCFRFYLSERKLFKFFSQTLKTAPGAPRIKQRAFVLSKKDDRESAKKKYRELYINPRNFILSFAALERAVCPGFASNGRAL